jgi:hypothetical protein
VGASAKARTAPIKEMLLAPEPRFDLELPLRGEFQRRKPVAFE